jgi:hypothetical protein
VLVTKVKTVDKYTSRDTVAKKNQYPSYGSGFLFSSHNSNSSNVTYNFLSGRHDTIFNDGKRVIIHIELNNIP